MKSERLARITHKHGCDSPHAERFDIPPYTQSEVDLRAPLSKIIAQIDRIAPGMRAKSVRFHYYSEVYEIADDLLQHGYREIFLTDKPAATYRLNQEARMKFYASDTLRMQV